MKITYTAEQKATYFCDLDPGAVFKIALDSPPFLKTRECEISGCNAVSLVANSMAKIDPGTKVIPLDCELIIK